MSSTPDSLSKTTPPIEASPGISSGKVIGKHKIYAQVFQGVRQDSGDPRNFVKLAREFYDKQGITDKKVIVFSDALKVDTCLRYKAIAEDAGFQPTFGVGTFFTSSPPLFPLSFSLSERYSDKV